MMTGPAKTQMTLLESMRDDATFPNVRVRHDPRPWLARQDEAWVGEITLAVDRLHAWKPFAQKQLPYRSM